MAPTGPNVRLNGRENQRVKCIEDLDSATSNRAQHFRRNVSVNLAIVVRPATRATGHENEDPEVPDTSPSVVKLNLNEEKEEVEEGGYVWKEEPATDIDSLCGVSLLERKPQCGSPTSLSDSEQGSLAKNIPKKLKFVGKGQKRKNMKTSSKKGTHKRLRKDSLLIVDESLSIKSQKKGTQPKSCAYQKITGHGSGTHKTEQKGGAVSTQQSAAAAVSNVAVFPQHSQGQQNGGGGSNGDDDGDDNRKPPRKPPDYTKCGGKFVKPKKKTESNDMDVGSSEETENSVERKSPMSAVKVARKGVVRDASLSREMDVDQKRSNSDEEMPSDDGQQTATPHAPEVQPPVEVLKRLNMEVLKRNSELQHSNYCQLQLCGRCQEVEKMIHHFQEAKGTCQCLNCQLWPYVKRYHKGLNQCNAHVCEVCHPRERKASQSPVAAERVIQQDVLDVPSVQPSLDDDDLIVWKCGQIEDEMTHFRENVDYMLFNSHVGKGVHGVVQNVALSGSFEQKYRELFCDGLVMKQAEEVGDDEMFVYENTWRHPNFVHTYLVTKKMKQSSRHNIFMEKCERSLKDYLNQLVANGKRLEIWEAMFYWTQVVSAVSYLHYNLAVMHKDIKAENVLLNRKDNHVLVKLADFDTVKKLHNAFTQPGLKPKGTPGLVAPEVWRLESHGRPADIFNLAMFLLQLLFPVQFEELQKKIRKAFKRNLDYVCDFLKMVLPMLKMTDKNLEELIESCLNIDPSKRPSATCILESPAVTKYLNMEVTAWSD